MAICESITVKNTSGRCLQPDAGKYADAVSTLPDDTE
tara:strand:- start:458 stop:568 length:111 start_codon:yes stop_codon:yes gene_type:complete